MSPTPPAKAAAPRETMPDLSVSFAGIRFKNPVIAASGTFGYGIEFEDISAADKSGYRSAPGGMASDNRKSVV